MPADSTETKRRILSTATRLFAERGYETISLRRIASEAEVQLALIQYHFGSKRELYNTVWETLYATPAEVRAQALARLDFTRPTRELVAALVDIVLYPMNLLGEDDGREFLRIVGMESVSAEEPEHGLIEAYIDPTARGWIAALRRALPSLTDADIAWGFQITIATMTGHVGGVARVGRLSDGAVSGEDWRQAQGVFRDFLVGGWMALDERRANE